MPARDAAESSPRARGRSPESAIPDFCVSITAVSRRYLFLRLLPHQASPTHFKRRCLCLRKTRPRSLECLSRLPPRFRRRLPASPGLRLRPLRLLALNSLLSRPPFPGRSSSPSTLERACLGHSFARPAHGSRAQKRRVGRPQTRETNRLNLALFGAAAVAPYRESSADRTATVDGTVFLWPFATLQKTGVAPPSPTLRRVFRIFNDSFAFSWRKKSKHSQTARGQLLTTRPSPRNVQEGARTTFFLRPSTRRGKPSLGELRSPADTQRA